MTIKCDLGPDLDLEISRSNMKFLYISTKSGTIAMKQKTNLWIWTRGLKCNIGFDLGHDIDILIFNVICDFDHLVTKVRCKDLPGSDRDDFRCRHAVDSSNFVKRGLQCNTSLSTKMFCLCMFLSYLLQLMYHLFHIYLFPLHPFFTENSY